MLNYAFVLNNTNFAFCQSVLDLSAKCWPIAEPMYFMFIVEDRVHMRLSLFL